MCRSRLFPSIDLPGLGQCEDGGLKANCPAPICRRETRYMWPWMPEPGILISLATGSHERGHHWEVARHTRRSGFIGRLYSAFMSSMDADIAWGELLAQLDESTKESFYRLTVDFKGQLPFLSSVSSMDQMIRLVNEQGTGNQVRRALSALLVSSLFFEVQFISRRANESYHCLGTLRCRIAGLVFISILTRLHPYKMTYFYGSTDLGLSPSEQAVCEICSRYCLAVQFTVKNLDEPITLSLRLGDDLQPRLGGFPHPLRWFLQQQGLDTLGGNDLPARAPCKSCDRNADRRKMDPTTPRKRDLIHTWGYQKRVRFI
jgi:hypothetical protein